MCIKTCHRTRGAWTLLEMMTALGIFSICGLAIMGLYLFSIKGMAAIYNYALLDQYNRQAMDTMTREIRQAQQVLAYTTNSITLQSVNADGTTGPQVSYQFVPGGQKLVRNSTDGTSRVLLNNCSLIQFNLYCRIPSNGTYNCYPAATASWSNTVKVIQLTWKTSITNGAGFLGNSENIQTALVVIRKQQDS